LPPHGLAVSSSPLSLRAESLLCLPKEMQNMTLRTIRTQILLVPGELVRTQNKPTLKLPASYWYKDKIEYALKKLDKIKL